MTTRIQLNPHLDLLAAAPLRDLLLAHRGQAVGLDASAVTRLGGQCLQVLLSARATWRDDGADCEIVEPSAAFVEQARLMGATGALGLECEGATQ